MNTPYEDTVLDKNKDVSINLIRQDISYNKGPKFGKRHYQVIMLTIVMFVAFVVRTSLSLAIVAMTDTEGNKNNDIPTYDWHDKSLVVGSFLWGYCIPQIAAGYLADRYGAKWFLVTGTFVTSTIGMLIPIAASVVGSKGVMLCRFTQGLFQSFLYPSIHATLGKWTPSNERSRLGTFVYTGSTIGIVVSLLLTGYISSSRFGWPATFYVFNGMALVVSVIYACVGSSDPTSHPSISKEERHYIKTNLNTCDNRDELSTPWREMFTSPPFLSLLAVNIASNWTYWVFMTLSSIYLNKVLDFDLESNTILSALPYAVEIVFGLIICFVADYILSKHIISTTAMRKIMNNIALVTSAISLFLLGRVGPSDKSLAVTLIVLVCGSQGAAKSGHIVNQMDLAPNFSGLMMGITNGLAVVFSAFTPIMAQVVITDEMNVEQWKIVFYITMSINIFAAITNSIFTSGERQIWNEGSIANKGIIDKGKAASMSLL